MDALNSKRVRIGGCLLAVSILTISATLFAAEEKPAVPKGTTEKGDATKSSKTPKSEKIIIKGLTLKIPAGWTKREATNKYRLAEFEIPPVDGDHEPAELRVTQFGGGDAKANIERWIKEFEPAERKVTAVQGAAASGKYQIADLIGNFKKSIGPPIQGQFEVKKGWRVINVRLEAEAGLFFLKLAGPEKTVTAAAEKFRHAFGADVAKETEFSLPKE